MKTSAKKITKKIKTPEMFGKAAYKQKHGEYGQKHKRGFFFSYDALVAGVIFTLFLALIFTYWTSMRAALFPRADEMLSVALSASETLLSPTPQFGLVDAPRSLRLNATKVKNFANLADPTKPTYDELRRKLAASYEFVISIGDVQAGSHPEGHEREKVSITRAVVYENEPVNMTVMIWIR